MQSIVCAHFAVAGFIPSLWPFLGYSCRVGMKIQHSARPWPRVLESEGFYHRILQPFLGMIPDTSTHTSYSLMHVLCMPQEPADFAESMLRQSTAVATLDLLCARSRRQQHASGKDSSIRNKTQPLRSHA